MNKHLTLNELERIEKISKISKIGVYFYIPKGKPNAYVFTKDNGSLQEIVSGSMGIFDRDIYISNDDIKRMIKEAKQGISMFSYYDWYYEINKRFNQALNTIQSFLMTNQLVYKKEDYNKSEELLDLYKAKADDGARRLTFESNDYCLGYYPFGDTVIDFSCVLLYNRELTPEEFEHNMNYIKSLEVE